MKPMGFSAKPEKLGRFRGHFAELSDKQHEDEGRVSTGHSRPLDQPAPGAETTADESFRGLTTVCWH